MTQCKIKFSYDVELIKMEIQCKFVLPTLTFRCILYASTKPKYTRPIRELSVFSSII